MVAGRIESLKAMNWSIGNGRVVRADKPLIMGILNVTPDSFSDGGSFHELGPAVDRALEMISEGAALIDIGGESTRPSASEVPIEIERRRVIPVIEALVSKVDVPLSVDTMKPEIARLAVAAGASIVNDVGAASRDAAMLDVVRESGCGYVCMHMKGNPRTMQQAPEYRDVVCDVDEFFTAQIAHYHRAGVKPEQVVLDVGIGFGKTLEHNLRLLRHLENYKKHCRPLLLGASRKSFIGKLLAVDDAGKRVAGGLACVCWGLRAGVGLFRVHDVSETSHAIQMWRAIESET